MAKGSKKMFWIIPIVLLAVVIQLGAVGAVFIGLMRARAVQFTPPNQPIIQQDGRRNFQQPPPIRRVPAPSNGGTKNAAAKQKAKPTGPRAEPPQFSKTGGIYTNTVTVELKAKSKKAIIRYTLDGSDPVAQSPAYATPIPLAQTTLLRAACFEPGLAPSLSISHSYTLLDNDLGRFTSNLPVVVVDLYNQRLNTYDYVPGSVRFISPSGGRTQLLGPADYDGNADLKRRGYSSLRFPKSSYTIKMRNDDGEKVKSSIYGMPADSDWVLYAPYSDKTMMRDVIGYEMSRAMGHYAPRTRLVEVFAHTGNGTLTYRDYAGVYVLAEKIKRGKERVNIEKLRPEDTTAPEVTGGYILKRDHGASNGNNNRGRGGGSPPRAPNDGTGFITPRGLHLFYAEPDEDELNEAQKKWVGRYMADFERALYSVNFSNPTNGYAKYLDVATFIDYFWLVEFTRNVDGFRYSSFFHIPRGGKITMGPAWDWNLSFGNADYYDAYETSGWYYENLRDTEISWIDRLREDPDFMQRATDRWAELRRDVFASDKMMRQVDGLRAQLEEAQARNFRRWPIMGREVTPNYFVGQSYAQEIDWMKKWMKDRATWIDLQFPATPTLSEKSGAVAAGAKVTLSGTPGEIIYTLDGSDPRVFGGGKSASAQVYKTPLTIDRAMKITARLRRGEQWSAPVTATYTAAGPSAAKK